MFKLWLQNPYYNILSKLCVYGLQLLESTVYFLIKLQKFKNFAQGRSGWNFACSYLHNMEESFMLNDIIYFFVGSVGLFFNRL